MLGMIVKFKKVRKRKENHKGKRKGMMLVSFYSSFNHFFVFLFFLCFLNISMRKKRDVKKEKKGTKRKKERKVRALWTLNLVGKKIIYIYISKKIYIKINIRVLDYK